MVNEKERAAQLERLAPKPTAQEMEQVNDLFRHFIFKRNGRGEIWTTCCRRHTFVKPDTDNADELRVLSAPHTPEPRNGWDHSPTVKRRCRCPYCGAEVTVKELRYTGGRGNLAEAVAAMTEQRGRGYASDKESWADLTKRVEECDDLLKNVKKVQKDMWKAIRENDPDSYGALAAEMVRESMTMTANWLGITAASKVALEMTEE